MSTPEERRAANDERVANDIRTHGCHVISVFDPEEQTPTFSYSIGIQARTGAPEVIVIGVRPNLGHSLVNEYNRQVTQGVRFERGVAYTGFLDGFSVYFEAGQGQPAGRVHAGLRSVLPGQGLRGGAARVPQHRGAVWPWQPQASDWFRQHQPMLGRRRSESTVSPCRRCCGAYRVRAFAERVSS